MCCVRAKKRPHTSQGFSPQLLFFSVSSISAKNNNLASDFLGYSSKSWSSRPRTLPGLRSSALPSGPPFCLSWLDLQKTLNTTGECSPGNKDPWTQQAHDSLQKAFIDYSSWLLAVWKVIGQRKLPGHGTSDLKIYKNSTYEPCLELTSCLYSFAMQWGNQRLLYCVFLSASARSLPPARSRVSPCQARKLM